MSSMIAKAHRILTHSTDSVSTQGRKGDDRLLKAVRQIIAVGGIACLLPLANCTGIAGQPYGAQQAYGQQYGQPQTPGQSNVGGMAIGGLFGAAIGGGIGNIAGGHRGRDTRTFIGALVGGATGAAIGGNTIGTSNSPQQGYGQGGYQQGGGNVTAEDDRLMRATEERAFNGPLGVPQRWQGPTGNWGVMTPIADGRTPYGELCRTFQTEFRLGDMHRSGNGSACLDNSGRWRISDATVDPFAPQFATVEDSVKIPTRG